MATRLFTTSYVCLLCVFSSFMVITNARPERGKWINEVSKDQPVLWYVKSLYNGSKTSVSVECQGPSETKINVQWLLRRSPCAQEYMGLNSTYVASYLINPGVLPPSYTETEYKTSAIKSVTCTSGRHFFLHPDNLPWKVVTARPLGAPTQVATQAKSQPSAQPTKQASVAQPAAATKKAESAPATKVIAATTTKHEDKESIDEKKRKKRQATPTKESPTAGDNPKSQKNDMEGEEHLSVVKDGYYLMVLRFTDDKGDPLPDDFKAEVTVRMMWGENNFISAGDWPLLIFYGVMGLVYIGFGVFWLFMLACNWKDLLRVQFWIGGVIFLGMLEKAVFFAEYENINNDGVPVRGAIILAELVSCIKRGLARMLVIIVCLGFGIIKPRLGSTLHRVVIVGVVYIVLASIEGCMRATKERPDQSTEWMFAAVPLAVTDAIICWWIFSALLQTTRTLRLRRNVVKLSLYRHFTNTLIFAIVASIAYMIWFLTQHRFKHCITDWKELWVDEAFWHLLFSVILFIIMILWRPTANNQRYAFSPLLDAAEDEVDDDQVLSEAYEGMKMRTTKTQQRNGSPRSEEADKKMKEDDLKWVEENIPSSLADKLLPALDSDEEIMNQKFEVSKME